MQILTSAVRWLAYIPAASLTTGASSETGVLRHNGSFRNQMDRDLEKEKQTIKTNPTIFTKRNTKGVFCLFNRGLQGTYFN